MGKVLWFHKLNDIRIKSLQQRKRRSFSIPPTSLCNLSPRSLPRSSYIKLCSDSHDSSLPIIKGSDCFGCVNSVQIFPKAGFSSQLSTNQAKNEDDVDTPHPCSPRGPSSSQKPVGSLFNSTQLLITRSSPLNNLDVAPLIQSLHGEVDYGKGGAQKKVVLRKKKRRDGGHIRYSKSSNIVNELNSGGGGDDHGDKANSSEQQPKKGSPYKSKSPDSNGCMKLNVPSSSNSTSALVDQQFCFEDYSSFTSDDNLFSSFERGIMSHSSNSSAELVERYHGVLKEAQEVNGFLSSTHMEINTSNKDQTLSQKKSPGHRKRDSISGELEQITSSVTASNAYKVSNPIHFNPRLGEELNAKANYSSSEKSWTQRAFQLGQLEINEAISDQKSILSTVHEGTNSECETPPSTHCKDLLMMQRGAQRRKKNWRSYSSRRGGAASAALRRKDQIQARWELKDKQVEWESGDDESSANSSMATPTSLQASDSIFATSNRSSKQVMDTNYRQSRLARSCSMDTQFSESNMDMNNNHNIDTQEEDEEEEEEAEVVEEEEEEEEEGGEGGEGGEVRAEGMINSCNRGDHHAIGENSVAVVKCSKDPFVDFRDSMVDMILEKQMFSAPHLEELLQCFLSLNSTEHHPAIIRAFTEVWKKVFDPKSPICTSGSRSTFNLSPAHTPSQQRSPLL